MNVKNKEIKEVPLNITFPIRINDDWQRLTAEDIFKNKKVIVFSLPGAFTPTCSSTHLPRYEDLYDTFKDNGIDEVYCISVNDTFVMNEWAKASDVKNVKLIPDGNAEFTELMGMLVDKKNLGFGKRSWRYSMLVDNTKIKKIFIEPDIEGDPFEVSDADTMLNFINPLAKIPDNITVFTKEGCKFCNEFKKTLNEEGKKFNEVCLPDAIRQKVLSGITGETKNTVPHIYINGKFIGGLKEYKNINN